LNWNLKELDGYARLHTARVHCVEGLVASLHRVLRLDGGGSSTLAGDRERADQVGASALEVDALRALVADGVPPSTDEIRGLLLVDEDEVAEQAGDNRDPGVLAGYLFRPDAWFASDGSYALHEPS
jgi:hypothetical protein